jgi:hypothetical protein
MKRTLDHSIDTNPKKEIRELTINDMLMIRGGGKVDGDEGRTV